MSYQFKKVENGRILNRIELALPIIKEQMASMNNPQWTYGYPDVIDFQKDIQSEILYQLMTDDNAIIGVAAFSDEYETFFYEYPHQNEIVPTIYSKNVVYIHRIMIFPDYKKKGLGEILGNAIIDCARSLGYDAVQIDTHELNVPMNKSLLKSGFKYTGSRPRDGKPGLWNLYEYVLI